MKPFVIPSIFTAVDKFSSPVDKMTKSVGAFAATTQRNFRNAGKEAYALGKSSGKVGLALVAPLALAAKAAVDFEDKMADVAKVANVKLGSKEFESLSESALFLSKTLAISAEESAGLMANLAQGGVAIADLDRVSILAGKMGVAFGISGDLAGQSFVKTKNALGGTIEETEKLMDAVNFLGNSYASSSAEVLTFLSSGGSGVARALNASGESVAAFGAHLISVGKSAEESATIMEKFTREALKDKELNQIFKQNGEGASGMLAIIEKGSKLSGKAQDEYFGKFGNFSTSIQLMAKDFGGLSEKVSFASDATKTANSVNQEFENRSNTTAFKLAQMKAQFTELAIKIGSAVIPIIQSLIEKVAPFITKVTDWIARNKELTGTIVKVVAVIGALALGISALAFIYGTYQKAMVIVTAVQWALNTAMAANPVGLIVLAVVALVAGVVALYKNWDKFKNSFTGGAILYGIKKIGSFLIDFVLWPLQKLLELASKIPGLGDLAGGGAKQIQSIRDSFNPDIVDKKPKPVVNVESRRVEEIRNSVKTEKSKLEIDFKNMPAGVMTSLTGGSSLAVPANSSTR
jgi:TP901 family phage tail tape measure protein